MIYNLEINKVSIVTLYIITSTMALSVPPPQTTQLNNKPKFDSGNLPNQNAHEAMMFSIRQGAYGGLYGLIGSTTFSLLANRFCKGIMGKGEEGLLINHIVLINEFL